MPNNNRRSKSRRRKKILGMSQELFFTIVFSLAVLAVIFSVISVFQHYDEKERISEETQKKDAQIENTYQAANDKVAETDNYKTDTIVRISAWDNVISDESIDEEKIKDVKNILKDANIVLGPYSSNTKLADKSSTDRVKIVEKRSVKFAIVSYEEENFEEEKIIEDLAFAKEKAKITICLMKWGNSNNVTKSQEDKAKFLVDNGANIIIGSTPTGLQKMEIVENKEHKECLVAYGVGTYKEKNSESTRTGIILSLQVYITKEGVADIYKVNFTPIYYGDTKVYDVKNEITNYESEEEGSVDKKTYDILTRALQKVNTIIKG